MVSFDRDAAIGTYEKLVEDAAERTRGLEAASALIEIVRRGNVQIHGIPLHELMGVELGVDGAGRIAGQREVEERLDSARNAVDEALRRAQASTAPETLEFLRSLPDGETAH